ncbi:MAG: hypothetical protein ACR2KX_15335 [Chitinophagaceae bacterium]
MTYGRINKLFSRFQRVIRRQRIEKRAAYALQKLTTGRSSSLRQITQSDAEQKSFTGYSTMKVLVGRALSKAL